MQQPPVTTRRTLKWNFFTPPSPEPHLTLTPPNSTSPNSTSPIHPPPSTLLSYLASSNRRPGVNITSRNRPIKLEQDTGVGRLVGTGERDQLAAGVERAGASGHVDLRARNVQLRAADAAGAVQGNVLDAQEVLAWGEAGGEADGDFGFAFFAKEREKEERVSKGREGTRVKRGLGWGTGREKESGGGKG